MLKVLISFLLGISGKDDCWLSTFTFLGLYLYLFRKVKGVLRGGTHFGGGGRTPKTISKDTSSGIICGGGRA